MTTFTAANYLQDGARTVAEMKTAFEQNLAATKEVLGAGPEVTLTISGTSLTPAAGVTPWINVATPGGAASANLTNIVPTNMKDGAWVALKIANAGQLVVLKQAAGGSGQLNMVNAADLTLADLSMTAIFRQAGGQWWEITRSYGTQGAAFRTFYGTAGLGQNRFSGRQGWCAGAALTAASTLALGTDGNYFSVNGSATINGIAAAPQGTVMTLLFTGSPVLVHSSVLQLGGFNIQAQPNMLLDFISDGGGVWHLKGGGGSGGVTVFARSATLTTVSNTTAETGLYGVTVPAQYLTGLRRVRLEAVIILQDNAGLVGTNYLHLYLYLGGALIAGLPIVTAIDGDGLFGQGVTGLLTATVSDLGTAQWGSLSWQAPSRVTAGGLIGAARPGVTDEWGGGVVSVDSGVSQLLQLNARWEAAAPQKILQVRHVIVTLT